jgi:hypothetical protein
MVFIARGVKLTQSRNAAEGLLRNHLGGIVALRENEEISHQKPGQGLL